MRGVAGVDLEQASAQDVLKYAVEQFYPRLTMACSFQKEESVLVHMLSEIEPSAHVFTIDTGVMFAETLTTWKAFEDRFGVTAAAPRDAEASRVYEPPLASTPLMVTTTEPDVYALMLTTTSSDVASGSAAATGLASGSAAAGIFAAVSSAESVLSGCDAALSE